MHESELNRLRKLQTALLLASADMDQAAAAARALELESDRDMARALETAMAVCYMRPFAGGDFGLPPDRIPTGSPDADRHASLKRLRDKIYAHTDKASGRRASVEITIEGEIVTLGRREQWLPFPRELLPSVIEYAESLRDAFLMQAAVIELNLRAQ